MTLRAVLLNWELPVQNGGYIKFKVISYYKNIEEKLVLFSKRTKNRIPDGVKEFTKKYLVPYTAIMLVVFFVLISNFAHATDNISFVSSDEVMDLEPIEVADVVTAVNPYTPNFQEDSVQVTLAMKDDDFLGKPMITETNKTEIPEENRKSTITYTVTDGDTLSGIGWKFGLKIATIKTVNDMSSDTVRPGQNIKLPPEDLSAAYVKQATAKKKVAGAKTTNSGGAFRRPTSGWSVSQVYGRTSFERFHDGVDLDSRSGTTIYASASGRIASATRGWGGGYGNHIVINHGNGFSSLYGHLSSFLVSSGDYVEAGQAIGIMGSTGWSTGVHLHFKIMKNGSPVNPMNYL